MHRKEKEVLKTRTRWAAVAAAAGIAAAVGAVAPAASAQPPPNTVQLANGETSLHLDGATAGVLTSNGVSVAPIGSADASGTRVDFPISGGSIVPNTGAGTYNHQGSGLRLRAGGVNVDLQNFVVNSRNGTVSAQVGGSRVTILTLDTSDAVVIRRGAGRIGTWIVRVDAELSGTAAAALNAAFDTDLFSAGIRLGRVDVKSSPAQVILRGGGTLLTPSDTVAQALQSLGVQVSNVPPAAANTAGALNFPVTGRRITLAGPGGPSGTISHSGGIALSAGSTNVELTKFNINVDSQPDLTSLIGGANRTSILDLDLSNSKIGVSSQQLVVTNVATTLTPGAANALNGAFGVTAFQGGLDFGTARVQARVR